MSHSQTSSWAYCGSENGMSPTRHCGPWTYQWNLISNLCRFRSIMCKKQGQIKHAGLEWLQMYKRSIKMAHKEEVVFNYGQINWWVRPGYVSNHWSLVHDSFSQRWFLGLLRFVYYLLCNVNGVCLQLSHFVAGGLQSNSRHSWRIIKINRMLTWPQFRHSHLSVVVSQFRHHLSVVAIERKYLKALCFSCHSKMYFTFITNLDHFAWTIFTLTLKGSFSPQSFKEMQTLSVLGCLAHWVWADAQYEEAISFLSLPTPIPPSFF